MLSSPLSSCPSWSVTVFSFSFCFCCSEIILSPTLGICMHHWNCLFWFLLLFHVWAVPVQFMVKMLQILTALWGLHSSIASAGAECPALGHSCPVVWFCVTDRNSSVRFEVLTAVLLRIQVFRDVTFCRWVSCHGVAKNRSVFETFWSACRMAQCLSPQYLNRFTFFCYSLSKAFLTNHCHWTLWLKQYAGV